MVKTAKWACIKNIYYEEPFLDIDDSFLIVYIYEVKLKNKIVIWKHTEKSHQKSIWYRFALPYLKQHSIKIWNCKKLKLSELGFCYYNIRMDLYIWT